ncbi:50S ribosome-binding GTPase [Candidatus Woesearchaeota archaeon]|nr:50S ribosome-binding GTPase [Candidatus Woesearchaeota archaeon]
MPTNVTYEYSRAEQEYHQASTPKEKLEALKKMLSTGPTHKGAEKLRKEIKSKIAKIKEKLKKEAAKKKGGFSFSIKKEGAAQVILIGTPNSGKSTLLNQLTGAKVAVADYPFTTTRPEIGMMDIEGIKIQIVEIPAIVQNFEDTELGPTFLGIARTADLMVLMFNNIEERKLLEKELNDVDTPRMYFNRDQDPKKQIWQNLRIIKVYTKEPGKKPTFPPIALKKSSVIKDMAGRIHKDFLKRFSYAKVWGKSAKFPGQMCGLNHKLEDGDIVEIHLK